MGSELHSLFNNYFEDEKKKNEIIINDKGINFIQSDNNKFNELEKAQVHYTKKVFNSNRLQLILFFIATIVLIGMILAINASGNLSFVIIIILVIIIFIIFKFLKFDMINYILNFKM